MHALLLVLLLVLLAQDLEAQLFRPDDPLTTDRDNLPIARPRRRKINDYYDFLENTFFKVGERVSRRAVNINTLGEVPDSSWYTNRISVRAISREELLAGANRGSGPAPGPLTVTGGKTQGISPGFTVKDTRGDTYFVKFDPLPNPEMATAAEVISSKFFHALGYNVPELYIITFRPEELQISPEARIKNELDEEAPLTRNFVNTLLDTVNHNASGGIRAIASKLIPGENIGPFRFYGTRRDDPNDIFPHEHRRELRGYYVLCSWLNHDDSRSINTLDMYVTEGGNGFVRHYLIDFGSTLGSGSVFAQKRRPGNEYMWEAGPTFASMFSLGLWLRPWVSVRYPDLPSVGRYEADFFQPEKWKPEYPNPAFLNMDTEDAFWATRQLLRFTDDDIRALVQTGRLSDPRAETYLAESLIKRKRKIGNYWLRQVSPLDNFRIQDGTLVFDDLLVTHGFETRMTEQSVRFSSFINSSGERVDLGTGSTAEGRVVLPEPVTGSPEGAYAVVNLSSGRQAVDVFLRKENGQLRIVGLERK